MRLKKNESEGVEEELPLIEVGVLQLDKYNIHSRS